MKKIYVLTICLLTIVLTSCGGTSSNKSEEGKESIEITVEEPVATDFLGDYEKFVNQELARFEKSSGEKTIAESIKAAEDFVNKYGDPNAISMTPETQKKFNELRGTYEKLLQDAIAK